MSKSTYYEWTGTVGVNAGDVIVTIDDAWQFDVHYIEPTANTIAIFVSLDGTNYFAFAAHEVDATAGTTDVLTSTKAVRVHGVFKSIQVRQSGASAANARGASAKGFG